MIQRAYEDSQTGPFTLTHTHLLTHPRPHASSDTRHEKGHGEPESPTTTLDFISLCGRMIDDDTTTLEPTVTSSARTHAPILLS